MTDSKTSKSSATTATSKSTHKKPRSSFGKGGKRPDIPVSVRSRWEANIYRLYAFLVEIGELNSFTYEPRRYEFPVRSKNNFYIPDFEVQYCNGTYALVEVKAFMDKDSQVKLNRMKKFYPQMRLDIIGKDAYASLVEEYSHLVPNWE